MFKLILEIGWSPEQEEPPYAIGEELACDESPCLLESQALPEADGLLVGSRSTLSRLLLCGIVLMHIGELCGIDMLRILGLVVHELPEEHPHETEHTNDDECHLPAISFGKSRDGKRSCKSTYRRTSIEDRGGKGTVALREIFSSNLDCCREVACLTKGEDTTTEDKEIDRESGNSKGDSTCCLAELSHFGDTFKSAESHCCPATCCMQARAERPYEDSPKIALLGAHPVDELASEKARNGIHDREERGDCSVVVVGPVEFRSNELLIGHRQYLTIHVVDGGGHKQERT